MYLRPFAPHDVQNPRPTQADTLCPPQFSWKLWTSLSPATLPCIECLEFHSVCACHVQGWGNRGCRGYPCGISEGPNLLQIQVLSPEDGTQSGQALFLKDSQLAEQLSIPCQIYPNSKAASLHGCSTCSSNHHASSIQQAGRRGCSSQAPSLKGLQRAAQIAIASQGSLGSAAAFPLHRCHFEFSLARQIVRRNRDPRSTETCNCCSHAHTCHQVGGCC